MRKLIPLLCACLAMSAVLAGFAGATSSTKVSGLDRQSLETSMRGDLFEITGGKLAERKSHNKAILKLAHMLVRDHTKSYDESAALARRLGVEVPTAPTDSQVWALKVVAAMRGKTFNHWYSSLEAYDHEQDLSEARAEVQDGTNPEIRRDAKQEIPMLQKHLRAARAALRAAK